MCTRLKFSLLADLATTRGYHPNSRSDLTLQLEQLSFSKKSNWFVYIHAATWQTPTVYEEIGLK